MRAALFLFSVAAFGQPFVYYRGAVNSASFLPPGLPNGAIARGSMFTIFGRNLGPATGQQVSEFPLQTTFAGVGVELTQGSTKISAFPAYVSASQLNVILPSSAPLGAVSLRVVYNGQTSNPIPVHVTERSVGLFSVNGGGFGPGVVQNFIADANRPINSLTATARPGQVEILWGTGLGAASFADNVAPTPITIDTNLELFVGGKKANIVYAGRSPCCSSIDQIVFEVPADAPAGCYVPVVARSRGIIASNTVTMAIHPTGGACSDAHSALNGQRAGGKTAFAQLARETVRVDTKVGQPYDVTLDHLLAVFRNHGASDFYFNVLSAPPPPGTCTVYSGSADRMFGLNSAFMPPGAQLSPGSPLRVESGASTVSVPNQSGLEGTFYAVLGAQSPVAASAPTLLNGGSFTLAGPGSALAPAFRSLLDNVTPLNWTNRDQVQQIDRAKDLLLAWAAAPGASRGVFIYGVSVRLSQNAAGAFVCVAPSGATSFTVPAYVLQALPASDSGDYFATTHLALVNAPLASSVSLPGFDYSFLGMSAWSSKTAVTK